MLSGVTSDSSLAPLSHEAASDRTVIVEWNGREMRAVKNEWLVGLNVNDPSPARAEQIIRRLGINATFRFAMSDGKVALVELPGDDGAARHCR